MTDFATRAAAPASPRHRLRRPWCFGCGSDLTPEDRTARTWRPAAHLCRTCAAARLDELRSDDAEQCWATSVRLRRVRHLLLLGHPEEARQVALAGGAR